MKILMNGLIKENPTFVLLLGMCPTLATTTSAINGLSMGLATMAVLVCTNFVISCIKKITPDMVRIPVFIVVIAAFVTILQMLMSAYAPDSINQAYAVYAKKDVDGESGVSQKADAESGVSKVEHNEKKG